MKLRCPSRGLLRDYEPSCGPSFEALVYIPPGAACVKPLPAGARPDPPPQPPPRLSPRLRAAGSRVRGPARAARCGGWRGRVPRGAWRDSVTSSSRQRPPDHSPGKQVSSGHNSCRSGISRVVCYFSPLSILGDIYDFSYFDI